MSYEDCVKRGKIKEFSQGKELVQKEIRTAQKDLEDGQEGFERQRHKWTTIQSYYSMFHAARALLYAKNLREKSHYCLIIALKHHYVEKKKFPTILVEALVRGKKLREDADYYEDWSKDGAEEMLTTAREFLDTVKRVLNE